MRIGLFVPCFIDAFFPEVGIATLELLERFGHEVVYPRDQTCCGQPAYNSGDRATAKALAKQAIEAHAGTIHVRNLPDKGCVFTIDLPRHRTSVPK